MPPERVRDIDQSFEPVLSDQEKAQRQVEEQEAKRASWGSSPQAQADQARLMAMAGGEG